MLKHTLKHLTALLLLAAVITPATANAQATAPCAGALAWTGIAPACLSVGDTYRIIFVTSGERDATSNAIADYNTFVQAQADAATGTPFSGITFNALGGTATTTARDNTNTNRTSDGTGERIFYYRGQQVADNYDDLYDGGWDSLEARNQNGETFSGSSLGVWTGSLNNGITFPTAPLGSARGSSSVIGNAFNASTPFLAALITNTENHNLYALSAVLTVPEAPALDPANPTISIAAETSPVTEGTAATFTLTATPAPANNVIVTVTVTDGAGDFITGAVPTTVTITAATTTATLMVPTSDDSTAEAPGAITATVATGTGYTPHSTDNTASVTIRDDDTSTDATLSGLTLTPGTLAPTFATGTRDYTVAVANTVPSVTVTPIATDADAGATITVNGNTVTSGATSAAIPLTPGTPMDISVIVTAPDTTTMLTYTVIATRVVPTATLAGTLTEATLFASSAPTVTVTLVNTEYAAAGTLLQTHFTVTDDVTGTVSVSGFNRDSNTAATLMLAYSREDITANGTLSVALAAAGHNGAGALTTNTIPITASTGANVCRRTPAVRNEIVTRSAASECTSITDLATIDTLDVTQSDPGGGITALASGDFAGLTGLVNLRLGRNSLTTLPDDIFAGLSSLVELNLFGNTLNTLRVGVFAGLTSVQSLYINSNAFTSLPVGIFDGLDALVNLALHGNSFTPGTGLPAGIFDDVLNSLGPVDERGGSIGLAVDAPGRAAHFVCSRTDAADIVAATSGVSHCLRITAAQLNTHLASSDATLSGLTLTGGTLDPAFATGTTAYTVSVENSVASVTVTPTATDATGATITVNGNTVTSGNDSTAINLTPGTPMDISVIVTAADTTTTMTYTVTATRVLVPVVTVALNANIAGDDIVNIAERTTGFPITGTVQTGAAVSVTIGTVGTDTARPATVSDTTWTVTIPPADADLTGTSVTVTATATLAGHLDGTETRTLTVDLTAPTATYTPPGSLTVGAAITAIMPGTPSSDISAYTVESGDLPPGLVLNATTGGITGAPTTATASTAAVTIRLTDTVGNTTDVLIPFPAVTMGRQTLTGFSYSPSTTLADQPPTVTVPTGQQSGSTLSYASDTANICTVNRTTGVPTLVAAGTCMITVTASATANYMAATDTFTITVTPAIPAATLTGPLTEATLFATAPTVTVTLANTAYAAEGTLAQSHFTVVDTVDGTVTVSDFTRDSDTVTTLTLAYDNVDITANGTLSVTLDAAGHTGAGNLANTIPITASAGVNVCDRTAQVRDEIVDESSASECTSVGDLATIRALNMARQGISALQVGDFAGMPMLRTINVFGNRLEAIDANVFAGLTALRTLNLASNNIGTLNANQFTGLTALETIFLSNNNIGTLNAGQFAGLTSLRTLQIFNAGLTSLDADIFNGLNALVTLGLTGNDFTAGTGLPEGIFDDVLDTLGAIATSGSSNFRIDNTVRNAHFVCSRDDAGDIVDATTGVTDCLRISSTQFNTAVALLDTDATLSGLTLSTGILTPPFATATTTYTVAVANRVDTITVTPTATRTGATITVNAAAVDSGTITLAAGIPMAIPIVVTSADDAATMTYTVTATRAMSTQPVATLTGTVTEANLSGGASVLVTLENTVYTDPLTMAHFTVSDTVTGGTVVLEGFERMSDTVARLDLALESGIDVTAGNTVSVTVTAAGHEGDDPLDAGSLPIVPSEGLNICGRSVEASQAIVAASSSTTCSGVPDLATITRLDFSNQFIEDLDLGDFDGLDALEVVDLSGNMFTAGTGLPIGIFNDVLNTVTRVGPNGFIVDVNARAAHFACAHAFADDITEVTERDDCFLVHGEAFNGALVLLPRATLSGLTLSDGALSPGFASGTTAYTASVPNSVETVTVTPTAPVTISTIRVNDAEVDSGSSSADIALTVGTPRAIPIIVTSADTTNTRTYTVTVTRAAIPAVSGVAFTSTGPYALGEAIEVTVTFSENVTVAGTPEIALTVGGNTRTAAYTSGRGSANLVFAYTVIAGETDADGVSIGANALTTPASSAIRGAVGGNNAVLTHDAVVATTAHAVDTATPTLAGATVNGNSMVLTYNEAMDPSSTPANAAYTIAVSGGVTPPTVTGTTISGARVTLALSDAITREMTVTVSYTPGTTPLQDIAGNAAGGLTTRSVTNDTPAPLDPTATLVGTVTEANLFAATAPTVTVTLVNTAYDAALGTLTQSPFTVTDTVDGTVSVSGFTRDTNTVATLTLEYTGEDITADGTLTVVLAAAGHTGASDLTTNTINITASTGMNICGRTAQVQTAILAMSSATECTSVGDLATIGQLRLDSMSIMALRSGDFAGLTGMTNLRMNFNRLRTLPADIFDGLSALSSLLLNNNELGSLDPDIFDGLSMLRALRLDNNGLTTLPADIFVGLDRLVNLNLRINEFTADTGLPAGIFDDVLNTLGAVNETPFGSGFMIDDTVRDAHFVCSRGAAADAIVAATDRVDDCLRISAAQLANADTTAPTLTAATVNGNSLVLTYNENLDTSSTPADAAYTIGVSDGTPPTVTGTTISGTMVTLTLSAAVTRGVMVTVSYAPGTTPLQDIAGNDAAGLTTRSVTNDTPEPANTIYTDDVIPDTLNVGEAFRVDFEINHPDAGGGFGNLWAGTTNDCGIARSINDAGILAFTPQVAQAGRTCNFVVRFEDGAANSVVDTLEFTVSINSADPVAPVASDGSRTVTEGDSIAINLGVTGTAPVTCATSSPLPGGLTLNAAACTITGDVDEDAITDSSSAQVFVIDYTATNTAGFDTGTYTLTVVPAVGVTVMPTTLMIQEDGGTGTYTVVLNSAPTADVMIAVASTLITAATVMPDSLIFTTSNWNTAQTVTVTGFNDDVENPNDRRTATVTHTATSNGDDHYDGVTITSVVVTVTDDDIPPTLTDRAVIDRLNNQIFSIDVSIVSVILPEATMPRDRMLSYALTGPNGATVEATVPGLTYNTDDRILSGTPTVTGTFLLTYTVTETIDLTTSISFARTITGTPTTIDNFPLTSTVTRTDPNDRRTIKRKSIFPFTMTIGSPTDERTAQLNAQILPRVFLSIVDGGNQLIAERLRNGSAAMSGGGGGSMSLTGAGGLLSPGVLKQAGQWLAGDANELPWRDWVGGLALSTDGSRLGLSPGVSLYANGNYTRLSGDGGGLDWDGTLYGGHGGVDSWMRDDVLVGVSASYFKGEFDYTGVGVTDGEYNVQVGSFQPYIGWKLSEGVDFWASGSYGAGDVELNDVGGRRESDLWYGSVSVGVSGQVYASDALIAGGRSEVRLRGDGSALWVAMDRDDAGFEDLQNRRVRIGMEASHTRSAMGYGNLRTGLEAGVRSDSGDGPSGKGLEVGGSVEWSDAMPGLTLSSRGRVLTLGIYDEWGVSGALRLTPGPDGHGLSFSLSPSYGQENSGIERLWQAGTLNSITPGGTSSSAPSARMRMDSEIGYGVPSSFGMVHPYLAASLLQGGGQTQRMGTRWELSPGMKLNLEAARRERATANNEHRLQLQWEWSW